MSTFPSSLPLPLPVSGKPESGVIRTQMDVGPSKVRRRSTATARPLSFSLRLSGAQFDTLRTFYHTTLLEGSLAFDMDDPYDDVTRSFRFTDTYDWTLRSGDSNPDSRYYDVTLYLERLP